MTSQPTPDTLAALLRETFAEYDGDHMGFHVYKAVLRQVIIVEIRGVDLLPFNPGEGPRAVLDDYAAVIAAAGHEVCSTGSVLMVSPTPPTSPPDPALRSEQ
jgi:hypothetical protein